MTRLVFFMHRERKSGGRCGIVGARQGRAEEDEEGRWDVVVVRYLKLRSIKRFESRFGDVPMTPCAECGDTELMAAGLSRK